MGGDLDIVAVAQLMEWVMRGDHEFLCKWRMEITSTLRPKSRSITMPKVEQPSPLTQIRKQIEQRLS